MRPKVVILTLVVAFGLVGIMVAFKGVMGRHGGDAGGQVTALDASDGSPPPATNSVASHVKPDAGNTEASSEQSRAAGIEKELAQIRELAAEGADSPTVMPALLAKVMHKEAEVRKAAVDALVQLNDTNAVPGLEQALELTKDPREKVAVMDAIDYLKLPSATPDGPSEYATNTDSVVPVSRNLDPNSRLRKANKNGVTGNRGRPSGPRTAPGAQPASPAQTPPAPQP